MKTSIILGFILVCTIRIDASPVDEYLRLETPGVAKTISLPKEKVPNYQHNWMLESEPGTRISLQCNVALRSGEHGCDENYMVFNDLLNEKRFCGYNDFVIFSRENRANVSVHLDQNGGGRLKCLIQSITGSHANEYENIPDDEVDSSEHGYSKGSRKVSCNCGRSNKRKSKILNGHETNENEFPWIVHLHVLHELGPFRFPVSCGASILTKRHVLTAAHCVVNEQTNIMAKPTNLILVMAEHDSEKRTGNEQLLTGEKIFVRDVYMEKGLEYDDIAIIYTKETIGYNKKVGPICLEKVPPPLLHKQLDIMGWGMTETGKPSPVLLKSKARVMDTSICGMKPWDVCTATSPSSLCVGDSGGPLVMVDPETNRYIQIALVSKVRQDCKGGASASTLVSYYYDWIQEVIRETEPSFYTCHKI